MWMRRISSFSVSFNCLPSCHNLLSSIYNCPPATVTVNSGKTRDTGSVSLCKPRFIILHRDYAEAYCALYELDCGFHCASVDELLLSQKGQISGQCIYVYITIHPFLSLTAYQIRCCTGWSLSCNKVKGLLLLAGRKGGGGTSASDISVLVCTINSPIIRGPIALMDISHS